MVNQLDSFKELYETLSNGNHSDFNEGVKKLDRIELVMFIGYLQDNGSNFGVLSHTVTDRILKALYSN